MRNSHEEVTYSLPELVFVKKLLTNMHISSHIAADPGQHISTEIDLGLRAMLFGLDDYASYLQSSMLESKENTIYRFFDEYFCCYMFLKMPDRKPEQYFFVGPYLCASPSDAQIRAKAMTLDLDQEHAEQFLQYYYHLPILEDENMLFAIMNTLGDTLWSSQDNYRIEYIDYMIPDRTKPVCAESFSDIPEETASFTSPEQPVSLDMLERSYQNEKWLMEAVSQGHLHKVSSITSAAYNSGIRKRISDSLRNRKNYLIILNTVLRIAAEWGGVHPLHIDRMSSEFAHRIEQVRTIDKSLRLQSDMIREYCLLVKRHSLNNHSYLVGKTITLISYDLSADLGLKHIAAKLNVNPSYLSALFHKECGCTLTEYVNQKRMEHAAGLLGKTTLSINAVAAECGITDTNYFIKLFKRFSGLTPTQYRNQTRT